MDGVVDSSSMTDASIRIMFDSLRGKTVEERIKEAKAEGAKKALEDAGIISAADDTGAVSGDKNKGRKSTLTADQQTERDTMQLDDDAEYTEILKGLQEKDKLADKPPRKLISS